MKNSHVHTKPARSSTRAAPDGMGSRGGPGAPLEQPCEQDPRGREAQLRSPLLSSCPRQALLTHSPAAAALRQHVLLLRAGGGGGHQHPLSFSLLAGQSGAALLGRSPGTLIRLEGAAPAAGGTCLHNTGAKPAVGRQRQSSTQRRAVPVKPTSHKSQHLPS